MVQACWHGQYLLHIPEGPSVPGFLLSSFLGLLVRDMIPVPLLGALLDHEGHEKSQRVGGELDLCT